MSAASNPLHPLLRKLETHARIAVADREAILALPCSVRTLEPQSYVRREADMPDTCAVIVSGFAFRQKLAGDGSRQIVSIHIPGDPIDFQSLFLDSADHNIQTLTRAELALIPRLEVQKLIRTRPGVAQAIMAAILVEASMFRETILNIGRRDASMRLAHLLCEFAIRLEAQGLAEDQAYEIPMTQEQLADALGLTPVHVNRTIKALEAEGFIERDRRRIRFPNWRRMRGAGDFTERYLHLEQQVATAFGSAGNEDGDGEQREAA